MSLKTLRSIRDNLVMKTDPIFGTARKERLNGQGMRVVRKPRGQSRSRTDHWAGQKLHGAIIRGYFRTVDLFAGCGGMTLGFDRAGFKCISAIEINECARKSHVRNFLRISPKEGYAVYPDITKVSPEEAVSHIMPLFSSLADPVDVIIGGPPCQAFSRLGRAALWRLAGKEHAHGEDERATMYHSVLRYIASLRPIAFVMENVREIGKFVGRNVAEEIAQTTDQMGYETRYALLNAVWYGVPQLRERMFIVGIRKELALVPKFPEIRYGYEIPVGYSTSRSLNGGVEVLSPHHHYVPHGRRRSDLRPAITAAEAFYDLPPILSHLDGRSGKGVKRDGRETEKYLKRDTEYTRLMKTWADFEAGAQFAGHVIRYTPRDYEVFREMPHGGQYPEALLVAQRIFERVLRKMESEAGRQIRPHSCEWKSLRDTIVPPYKVHRYPNKFRKMWPDHPARTIPAHIGKDSYSHIHFDSDQARTISVREAARLQSFPDGFVFEGHMNAQFTQIGNAVPPILAFHVADTLKRQLLYAARRAARDVGRRSVP
jgi:DNA (cytosine-5)-methyltransferase 1